MRLPSLVNTSSRNYSHDRCFFGNSYRERELSLRLQIYVSRGSRESFINSNYEEIRVHLNYVQRLILMALPVG